MNVVLGLDIGASRTRGALFRTDDLNEAVREFSTFRTHANDYDAWLGTLYESVDDLIQHDTLVATGAGVAGRIKSGIVEDTGNLSAFKGKNVREDLSNLFNCKAVVMNDATAEALGEYTVRKAPLIFVGWGTGIGVSVVEEVDGKPVGRATEGGHIVINTTSKLPCGCGGQGHWEAHVGGTNLPGRLNVESIHEISDRLWNDKILLDFATGCRNLSVLFPDVPRIVIGGGVGQGQLAPKPSGHGRLAGLQKLVNGLSATVDPPSLSLAELNDPGVIGAVYAAQLTLS